MHRLFKLGGFCFAADHPDTLVFPPNFLRFETKDVQPAYFYTLRFVKSIPNPVGVCTAVREDLIVYRAGEKESRLLGIQGMLGFYALYRELDDTHAEVMIAEDCRGCLVFDPVFASLFALERRMLQKDSFILHSAYIRHRGRAILFSAPSGTGKSTQASLWAQYAGAEIITLAVRRANTREHERISRADHFRIIGDMRIATYMGKPAFNALQIAFAVIDDRDHASAPLVLGSWSAARGSISSA